MYKFIQTPTTTMYRLTQIIQNSYIRIEGLISQIFRALLGSLSQIFSFLSKILGFTSPSYLPEETQEVKPAKAEPVVATSAPQDSPPTATDTRRRPDASMDYFLKMAQPKKMPK